MSLLQKYGYNINDFALMDIKKLTKEQQKELFIKEAARRSLLGFATIVDPKFQINWHHRIIASRLERVLEDNLNNKPTRLMITLPPRHGKSYIASELFPAWCLGKHPQLEFVVCSYSAELAQQFGFLTRNRLEEPVYQSIFKTKLRADSQAKAKWVTTEKGSYTAVGVGGSLTGKGADILIIDDPFKGADDAHSVTIQKKVYEWYKSVVYTRQQRNSAIIIINTRWDLKDLSGQLLEAQRHNERAEKKNYDQWEIINFPAIAEEDEPYRKEGEALWPTRFPLSYLERVKTALTENDPRSWLALYQQRPIAAATQEFKREWFRYFEDDDLKKDFYLYKTTVDLAISEEEYADYTVILTVAKSPGSPYWYIVEITRGRLNPGETIDMIFYHQKKYNSEVYIETVAYQKALKYFIEEQQKLRETYFMIHELKTTNKKSKTIRIRGLVPMYERGIIHHRNTYTDLEEELLLFPQAKHDDIADALAYQAEAWQENQTQPGADTYGIIKDNDFNPYDIF